MEKPTTSKARPPKKYFLHFPDLDILFIFYNYLITTILAKAKHIILHIKDVKQ
jgi:hypothetical protein